MTHPSTIADGRVSSKSATYAPVVPFRPRRSRPLVAAELMVEIELLLDVIDADFGYPNHLTSDQVDAALQPPTHVGVFGASPRVNRG